MDPHGLEPNPYAQLVKDAEGLDKLQSLQSSSNVDIVNRASVVCAVSSVHHLD